MNKNNKFIYLIGLLFTFSCYNDSISKEKIHIYNMNPDSKTAI